MASLDVLDVRLEYIVYMEEESDFLGARLLSGVRVQGEGRKPCSRRSHATGDRSEGVRGSLMGAGQVLRPRPGLCGA